MVVLNPIVKQRPTGDLTDHQIKLSRVDPSILLACTDIEEEVVVGELRPDLLAATAAGMTVAIEVAYSSFCSADKCLAYGQLKLPALEIDLRAFTPAAFDVAKVKHAILEDVADLESHLIRNARGELANHLQTCQQQQSALAAKKNLARNNLAGATWEQSISAEMQAAAAMCDTKARDIRAKLEGYERELRELQAAK